MRRVTVLAAVLALCCASAAWADGPTCSQSPSQVSLERRLRQLSLDLLGRPPTLEEYRFFQSKGDILEEDVLELMRSEAFFERMRGYHRALLRSNISQSVFANGDIRMATATDGQRPLELRGNPATSFRGRINEGCDHVISQDDCNAIRQDPHAEPPTKQCRDAYGVPLPVSFDYSADNYACWRLDAPDAGVTDCAAAVAKGAIADRLLSYCNLVRLPDGGTASPDGGTASLDGGTSPLCPPDPSKSDKLLYYCDMRKPLEGGTASLDGGASPLVPYLCLPDPSKPVTAALTKAVLDADGRVVAFENPTPVPGALSRLDRCTLTLPLRDGVRGRYMPQPGCIQREGVVTVPAPNWHTSTAPVAMCAIEAQARTVNPWTMEACEPGRFTSDRSCGCGVGGRRCEPGSTALHEARVRALNDEPLVLIDSVLRRDEDYFSILTTRRGFVNGPLSQLFREQASPSIWQLTPPTRPDLVPAVPLAEASRWVEYTRDEQASGVLTTPSWLYRFPTQRSRVSQFWGAFLCTHFSPPAGALVPPPEDSCNRDNNLATRCGCSYCHAAIEPMGAHWGRFGERNAQYLDPTVFPRVSAKCRDCALAGNTTCDNECGNYVMQAFDGEGAQSLGLLRSYLYRAPDEEPNIVGGPRLLVERMMQTGELEKCAVKNLWNHLLGRPMTAEEERLYLSRLVEQFAREQHNLRRLMLAIVSTDAYRRVD